MTAQEARVELRDSSERILYQRHGEPCVVFQDIELIKPCTIFLATEDGTLDDALTEGRAAGDSNGRSSWHGDGTQFLA